MSNQTHSFVGNLTYDPEVRTVPSKNGEVNVVNFVVAVNGRTNEEAVFFDCEAWGQAADVIVKWFKKGKPIVINDAEARMDKWVDKTTGENRSRMRFRVNRFSFAPTNENKKNEEAPDAGEKVGEAEAPESTPPPRRPASRTRQPKETVPPVDDNDDIPF